MLAVCSVVFFQSTATAAPMTGENKNSLLRDSVWYTTEKAECVANGSAAVATGSGNLDYAGKEILTKGQLDQIAKNQPTYQKSASAVDIPWQMIAVIHLRESGLGRANPGNGQGIYQFVDRRGGPYPGGPVSDAEFQRQTDLVATFIKGKAGANYSANQTMSSSASIDAIKDTFFSYNGRAKVYEQQAARLGYSANTQGYEGSPYVMNKADAKRDPAVNKTTWGQVKRDFGPIEYPANGDYGAFVMYAALAGAPIGGCSASAGGGSLAKVIEIVKQELSKGVKEEPLGSDSGPVVSIYNQNTAQPWCAYFLSWAFKEAGMPFAENNGVIASVDGMSAYARKNNWYYPKGDPGFVPQPGDIVIYNEGIMPYPSHLNIVISYNPTTKKFTSIGGNESDKISQNEFSPTLPAITGFIRIAQ